MFGTTKSPQESLEKAIELAQTVIAQDDNDPYGHGLMGWVYCFKGEYDKAIAEGERAIALNPSGAIVHGYHGQNLMYAGQPEEAIRVLRKAIRLNPFGPGYYHRYLGNALLIAGKFEEAVSEYKKALQPAPNNFLAHLGLAATYSMMGREQEARAEVAEVIRINPKFSLDAYTKGQIYKDQSEVNKLVDALRKAGLK
jgi:adenylate cyclase